LAYLLGLARGERAIGLSLTYKIGPPKKNFLRVSE